MNLRSGSNIDFRPQNVDLKRCFVQQLPADTIPLLTWENGKSFEIDGMHGYLRDHAILEFEDLRLQLAAQQDRPKAAAILDRMETIVREELARTELSLVAATRDSRLGFQFECDYVYTPYSLREKLESLRETLQQLAERRKMDNR